MDQYARRTNGIHRVMKNVKLPNDAMRGPVARARACKLRKIPKIVPFSFSKPFFDAKLLITLTTTLEAKTLNTNHFVFLKGKNPYQMKREANQTIKQLSFEQMPRSQMKE